MSAGPVVKMVVGAEADVLEMACEECGNERSAVARPSGLGVCAWCLTWRVRRMAERFRNRFRVARRW